MELPCGEGRFLAGGGEQVGGGVEGGDRDAQAVRAEGVDAPFDYSLPTIVGARLVTLTRVPSGRVSALQNRSVMLGSSVFHRCTFMATRLLPRPPSTTTYPKPFDPPLFEAGSPGASSYSMVPLICAPDIRGADPAPGSPPRGTVIAERTGRRSCPTVMSRSQLLGGVGGVTPQRQTQCAQRCGPRATAGLERAAESAHFNPGSSVNVWTGHA